MSLHLRMATGILATLMSASGTLWAQGLPPYELPPINYSKSRPSDPVADLIARIARKEVRLEHDEKRGYLKAFLNAMNIPVSSQTLVFSKTSFQRRFITPWTPRALYFNDDVYVGWVPGGEVVEISAVDPKLGGVFYTLSQKPAFRPQIQRQLGACLQCHDSTGQTLGVPGHIVRSVFPGGDGLPHFGKGTYRTSPPSPFTERWGGWYVTGKLGGMEHMGNAVYRLERKREFQDINGLGKTQATLKQRVRPGIYLTDTSDITALMVLQHQTNLHNLITRAHHETLRAVQFSREMNKLDGLPPDRLTKGARSRIRSYCAPLVEAIFFAAEAPLPDPVAGDSPFAVEFEKRGPFDGKNRSLRQFDLKTRTFRYPCSFLVYSGAFRSLPAPALDYVFGRFDEILEGRDTGGKFDHLSDQERTAIREILIDTLPIYADRRK